MLIVGVGKGTKSLNKFLDCTKSYEAVVLFGAATDTYDAEGKVVKRAEYDHITEQKVRDALAQFRGPIKQIPPVFSALRVQGKRMYEYAREGGDIPQLEARAMKVDEMEMLEWYEGGKHEHHWPTREAETEEKDVAEKVLHLDEKVDTVDASESGKVKEDVNENSKRKREDEDTASIGAEPEQAPEKKIKTDDTSASEQIAAQPNDSAPTDSSERPPCPAPAARIRMTVSSGFYVRSLCHDLGIAVGSLGLMSTLVRTRQERFFLGKNVLEYDELAKGEDVWAPQVLEMLAEWDDNVNGSKKEQAKPKSEDIKQQAQGRRKNSSSEPEG